MSVTLRLLLVERSFRLTATDPALSIVVLLQKRRISLSCSPIMHYHNEVNYERWLVELFPRMRKRGDSFGDNPHLEYFVVSVQLDHV